jgi:hypothetical protein
MGKQPVDMGSVKLIDMQDVTRKLELRHPPVPSVAVSRSAGQSVSTIVLMR